MKGKDIKCPFDCLFHYFTRRFEPTRRRRPVGTNDFPDEFEKW